MYVSNSPTIFVDPETKTARTEILARLYGMDFNLIPVNGKHPPCIEWKPYQTQRVSPAATGGVTAGTSASRSIPTPATSSDRKSTRLNSSHT